MPARVRSPRPRPTKRLLYTFKSAAQLLSLTRSRVVELYRSGRLPAVRLAGTPDNPRGIRFTRRAILDFLASLPAYSPPRRKAARP